MNFSFTWPLQAPAGASRSTGHLVEFAGETMGTSYHVRLVAAGADEDWQAQARRNVHAALEAVDHRMSTYRADSELSALNRHAGPGPFGLSAPLLEVLSVAREVGRATEGAFDVTAGGLVNAWGFGPEKAPRLVAEGELRALRAAVGPQALRLDLACGCARKATAATYTDLSAIAKGYGVDRAAAALQQLGCADFMVEVGGEVRAQGRRVDGRPWQIGIEQPGRASPRQARYVVPLRDQAMATSGDYRICFEADGRRYSHEIDPRTGRPIAHALSAVTVVASDCTRADAFATGLIVLGPERGLALADRLGLAAYFVERGADGRLVDRESRAFTALGGRPLAPA